MLLKELKLKFKEVYPSGYFQKNNGQTNGFLSDTTIISFDGIKTYIYNKGLTRTLTDLLLKKGV